MPERVILINGLPGSGKTTLAGALSRQLNTALLSKDQIKEALADAVGLDFPGGLRRPSCEILYETCSPDDKFHTRLPQPTKVATIAAHSGVILSSHARSLGCSSQ